jgi:hypothetical protein
MGDIPEEDTKSFQVPEELRTAKEMMGGRLVIARPSHVAPPEKKGIRI